jgi:hypothetical protein
MFTQSLIAFVALAGYIATPVLAVPGASWVRRQEDAQTSRTLDPAVISEGLKQDGQGDNPDPGQVRSATSVNNFINHCLIALDQGVPLTNGKQIATGSCSQTPMGRIVSLDQSPRSKFVFPKNGDESLVENQAFTVQMKILNLVTGNFVNAQSNYYSAPQQVNDQGILIGHSHVTIQAIPDLQTTEPVDPTRFSFFKGFNDAAQNDILTATVTNGLPAGVYRMCSINTAANHQVALVSNAQHGALEDCSYFTVKAAGQTNNNNNNASTSASNSNTATATVSESASVSATATQSESASASVTESASVSNGANESSSSAADESSTDANGSTDVPTATESAAPEQSSPAQESDNASQEQPSETFSESSPAPEPTDNGNNNNNGDNGNNNNNGDNGNNNGNGDQGQNNGNTDGNNNNNNGNNGSNDNNNNQGNNDQNNGNNGDSSSAAPAPTENTSAQDPAASPSADSSSEAPAPEATPAPENGNNDNQNNGDNGAQTPGADTNVPQDPAADNTNNQGGDNQGNNGQN